MGRHPGLDACRAAAMLLGLFFHGAISFMETRVPWAIRDRSTSRVVDGFVWICHSFRMPVFFLLAGFFGRLLYVKLGTAGFLRHRAKRLLLPFLAALIPTLPALYLLWKWGLSRGGAFEGAPALGVPGFEPDLMLRSPGHLWFLYYLLILLVLAAGAARLGRLPVDGLLRPLVRFDLVPLAMALPTALVLNFNHALAVDTPVGFVPQVQILAFYALFLAFGWALQRQDGLVVELGRRPWIPLLAAGAAIVPLGPLVERMVRFGTIDPVPERMLALYLSAFFGWSLVVGFIGVFVKWGATPRPWIAYLSDASYWCYLVHLPVVVAFQILAAGAPLPGLLKYAGIMTGTLAVCLGSYQVLVRNTGIGRALNGPRPPRASAAISGDPTRPRWESPPAAP